MYIPDSLGKMDFFTVGNIFVVVSVSFDENKKFSFHS